MNTLSFKTLLEIILKVTQKNASILADAYLLKDSSIISKWKTNKAFPKSYDIDKIVEFTIEESSASQRKILRDKIEELVRNASIKPEIKKLIMDKEDFREFLYETLTVTVCAVDIPDQENTYEPEATNTCKIKNENSIKGTVYKKDNRFKGTLEIDIAIGEKGLTNSSYSADATNLELKGTVNLAPKKRLYNAAKYLGKTSILGAITILVLSALLIISSKQPPKDNLTVYTAKTSENQEDKLLRGDNDKSSLAEVKISTSVIPTVTSVLSTPTQIPESTHAPSTKPAQSDSEKAVQNSNSNNTSTNDTDSNNKSSNNKSSNNTNKSNINFSGNITINGNDNTLQQGVDIYTSKEGN
ncbi:MAG: hypothetical protein Q8942_18155 [Bacillota bacterium]|nr:hypothetical protein [Bacillota bacterium]